MDFIMVVYHSDRWETLVETGWMTWSVDEIDGVKMAKMIARRRY